MPPFLITFLRSLAPKNSGTLLAWLGLITIVAVIGYLKYQSLTTQLYAKGYETCAANFSEIEIATQAKAWTAAQKRIDEKNVVWEEWFTSEVSRIKAEQTVEVRYETIIQKIPTLGVSVSCPTIGDGALELFNAAIREVQL
jgi:hypothetical protein